jgi:hypothetical protein
MDSGKVELREFYNDFAPPPYVYRTVRALLSSVPSKYIQGLDCVVLTNQSGHPRRHRLGTLPSRKRRLPKSQILGLYHQAHRGSRPWIELYVDKIAPKTFRHLWIPLLRDGRFGKVLFHEIGHHIHATAVPEHQEKEDVADIWAKKLSKNFARRKYWYLIPIAKPLARLLRAWSRWLRR